MRKIEIGIICIALCIGLALILPQLGVSYEDVTEGGCLVCHNFSPSAGVHTESGHTNCASCHEGGSPGKNVTSDMCIVCHPLVGDKGKCELTMTAAHSSTCASCHDAECGDTTDTTTTVDAATTTTADAATTTTAVSDTTTTALVCSAQEIYGVNSAEVQVLRFVRDNILAATPEGREIIRLYYQLSPVIVAAMQNDPAFKAEVKAMSDGVLQLVVQ